MKMQTLAHRFDRRAARYDNPWTAFIGERELRQIRPFVPHGAAVLDYGCGAGRVTLDLLRRGCRVTAYDISQNMLARAKEKVTASNLTSAGSVEFLHDAASLEGRAWPCITCIGVLDYYPDPRSLLRSLRALLTPQGRLIVTFPNALSPLAWLYALGSRLTVPATPRTPAFARRTAQESGFSLLAERYAFPALPWLGHTLILALQRSKHD
jgi:2-polyprenyl-3-methyl-5-hydroxy-6-metoxy-1,4-benzoquinol methylase